MRIKVTLPDEMIEDISINALTAALKYFHILKILPAKTTEVKRLLKTDMKSAKAAITELDNFGLVSWHKKDGIVHKTRRIRTILNVIEIMKSEIKPDAEKIIMKKVNSSIRKM